MSIPTITAAEPTSRKVKGYDIYEWKPDRGIYRKELVKSLCCFNDMEAFLKANEEKWRQGFYSVQPIYEGV